MVFGIESPPPTWRMSLRSSPISRARKPLRAGFWREAETALQKQLDERVHADRQLNLVFQSRR